MTKFFVVPLAVLTFAATTVAQEKATTSPKAPPSPPAEAKSAGPGKAAAQRTTVITGKVTDMDRENRLVTLQTAKGEEVTMKIGPSVKRLDMVSLGDTLTAKYEQGLMLEYRPEGAAPAEKSSVTSTTTTTHEAVPRGTKTTETWATVTVAKVDPKSRVVTLQTEKGKTFQLKAAPEIDLSKLTAGQKFSAHYTETVAVSLTKPGAAKAAPAPAK